MKGWNPRRVREMMIRKRVTRPVLAEKCGITRRSLDNILRPTNPATPGEAVLFYMAEALDTSVAFLTFQTNDPSPSSEVA